MRLIEQEILNEISNGDIQFTPKVDRYNISGITTDLKLGNKFRVFNTHSTTFIDLSGDKEELTASINRVMGDEIELNNDELFVLHPGELALGITLESVSLANDVVGWLDGRSSLARLGLTIHITANRIDPGWSGNIVLEFFNSGKIPLALRPNMKIAALSFEKLSGPVETPYSERHDAKYKNQNNPTPSQLNKEQIIYRCKGTCI